MTDRSDRLRAQYEAYPYPTRDPADEARRLIVGSPSHLDELNHYVFGGRRDFAQPFSVLVAGGGTGDGAIMLAQQLADRASPARIAYLDLSDAARRIAEARAARRGLTNLTFHQGSLLDVEGAGVPGPFDYIDCCGMLHHLDAPADGLAALTRRLAPGGGIGLMVYAPYGRTGVYPLQEALRDLTDDLPPAERVALARRLIAQLPQTNWFRRNTLLSDHRQSDAGLFDLLLHSCDRPFTIDQVAALAAGADLAIAGLIEPARYRPSSYVADPRLLRRLERLDPIAQAAWAERISGSITKHIVYLVASRDLADAVARPDDPAMVPVLRDFDGAALGRRLPAGGSLTAELHGHRLSLPMPRLAGPMLARIDGRRSIGEIAEEVAAAAGGSVTPDQVATEFARLYAALNGLNKVLLRRPPARSA